MSQAKSQVESKGRDLHNLYAVLRAELLQDAKGNHQSPKYRYMNEAISLLDEARVKVRRAIAG